MNYDLINILGKSVKYKNYDCSLSLNEFPKRKPVFNLYIQITNNCNARCLFCDKASNNGYDNCFDSKKFISIYTELNKKNMIGKISITGGEPFLKIDKLSLLLNSIESVNPNAYVSINTNGSYLNHFNDINSFHIVKELVISRHHYNQEKNDSVFGIKTPSKEELKYFIDTHPSIAVKFNCVLSKDMINNSSSASKYLDEISLVDPKEVRFIAMLDLVKENIDTYVDPKPIIEDMKSNINIGMMYDRDICECFGFIYVSKNGNPIEAFVRNTKKARCDYLRQLVYNTNNNLLDGFNGNIII